VEEAEAAEEATWRSATARSCRNSLLLPTKVLIEFAAGSENHRARWPHLVGRGAYAGFLN
jgi:hypothetical protein